MMHTPTRNTQKSSHHIPTDNKTTNKLPNKATELACHRIGKLFAKKERDILLMDFRPKFGRRFF